MAEAINSTQDQIEDLQKQLATTIEQERKAWKGDLSMVDYCRIVCYFEQALCSHILPEVFDDNGWKVWDHMIPAEIRAMDVLRLGRKSILERMKPVGLKFAEENLSLIEDSISPWGQEKGGQLCAKILSFLMSGR
jgi:hypothetical protein